MTYTPRTYQVHDTVASTDMNRIENGIAAADAAAAALAPLVSTSDLATANVKLSYGAVGNGTALDHVALQAAIDAASVAFAVTGALQIVTMPRGIYLIGAALVAKSGVTVYGPTATIRTNFNGNAIQADNTSVTDFTVDGLTFEGPVTEIPTGPKRARTTSGNGMVSAVSLNGDLNTSGGGLGQLTNFTMRNCRVRNCTGLPILLRGLRGMVRVVNNTFDNNMDAGFTFNEEVIFNDNHVIRSADNGVSLSRGNRKITCTGNTFENCCYNGIFVAGFLTDLGPQNFSIGDNTVKNVGLAGILLDGAPAYGTIVGNELDGGLNRGPSDGPTDSGCSGIFIGGYPGTDRANPTAWADGLVINSNQIRRFPRAGIYLTSVKNSVIAGNQISDIGTQFLADGTTLISSADTTQNVGILLDQATTSSNLTIALNQCVDTRVTPYMNWAIVPVGSSHADESFNTMVNCRNAYNLIESGPVRNFLYTAVFLANSKHTLGATAGSSAGTGTIAGFDINGAAASARKHAVLTAGANRWRYGGDGTAESGSNAGTKFVLDSYDDAGLLLNAALVAIDRVGTIALGIQTADITVKGPLVSGAAASTVTAGAQAATAAAAGNGANKTAGTVNATAAASPAAGTLIAVAFPTAYVGTPHVVVTPQNAASATCQPYVTSRGTTGFTIACSTAPGAAASLSFDYHVIG